MAGRRVGLGAGKFSLFSIMKTVLVTGGAGFIGSRLCARLVKDGHSVISLDNYFAGSRANHVPGVEYREGHTKNVEKHVPETPDIIYHLGEYARVEQSLLEPDVVHELNTLGTRGVMEFWKKRRCKLVYAGSSTKFGDGGQTRKSSPYASTKAANTELVKEIGEREGLPYAITYFYNVYGPGERAGIYGTVIEAFKQMYLSGAPITVTAPGTQKRNFTHVDDIVDALVLVGEKGHGDEYGLGNEKSFTILEAAQLFGGDIIMLPPRAANRMQSALDANKIHALGWDPKRTLESYVEEFKRTHSRGTPREKRVLVFSTTFHPVMGPAEHALADLVQKMPDVRFDIVTSAYSRGASNAEVLLPNISIHRIGFGRPSDKYLLPFFGYRAARELHAKHRYLFAWSLMASYGALAAALLKRAVRLPLLITLADQQVEELSFGKRALFRFILSDADQVYGSSASHEKRAARVSGRALVRNSMGEGDAFANQLRYAYAEILLNREKAQ